MLGYLNWYSDKATGLMVQGSIPSRSKEEA